jgi:hypothetical protein
MELTHEQRLEFLKAYNDLRNTINLWMDGMGMSEFDVHKLENLQWLMHSVLKFVPQEGYEGNRQHYHDWVLADTDDELKEIENA